MAGENNAKPIATTIVAAGDLGGFIPPGTLAMTPGHAPNVAITVVRPIVAILVRFANAFFTTLVGLVMAAMATNAAGANIIHASSFTHLVLDCASLSVAGAAVGLFKDLVTIFGQLESKYPLATGSV